MSTEHPIPIYQPAGRKNFCHFPDYIGPSKDEPWQCSNQTWQIENERIPWCYAEEGVDEYNQGIAKITKYGYCTIDSCQCGISGLKYKTPAGDEFSVPKNLNLLKGEDAAEQFKDLITPWNENKSAENIQNSCQYWKRKNNQTEVETDVEAKTETESGSRKKRSLNQPEIFDETDLPNFKRRKSGPKVMGRIINGLVIMSHGESL